MFILYFALGFETFVQENSQSISQYIEEKTLVQKDGTIIMMQRRESDDYLIMEYWNNFWSEGSSYGFVDYENQQLFLVDDQYVLYKEDPRCFYNKFSNEVYIFVKDPNLDAIQNCLKVQDNYQECNLCSSDSIAVYVSQLKFCSQLYECSNTYFYCKTCYYDENGSYKKNQITVHNNICSQCSHSSRQTPPQCNCKEGYKEINGQNNCDLITDSENTNSNNNENDKNQSSQSTGQTSNNTQGENNTTNNNNNVSTGSLSTNSENQSFSKNSKIIVIITVSIIVFIVLIAIICYKQKKNKEQQKKQDRQKNKTVDKQIELANKHSQKKDSYTNKLSIIRKHSQIQKKQEILQSQLYGEDTNEMDEYDHQIKIPENKPISSIVFSSSSQLQLTLVDKTNSSSNTTYSNSPIYIKKQSSYKEIKQPQQNHPTKSVINSPSSFKQEYILNNDIIIEENAEENVQQQMQSNYDTNNHPEFNIQTTIKLNNNENTYNIERFPFQEESNANAHTAKNMHKSSDHLNSNYQTEKRSIFNFNTSNSNPESDQTKTFKTQDMISLNSNNQIPIILQKTEEEFYQNFDTSEHNIIQLGAGGFGTVFKVKDLRDQQFYAIKQMTATSKSMAEMLEKEIKIYQRLFKPHPNIMSVIEYYYWEKEEGLRKNHNYMLVLQLAKNSLSEEIEIRRRTHNFYKISQIKNLMYQCSIAMGHLRIQGIFHRDIKPANILLMDDEGKHIKLTDYGISKDILNSNTQNHTISYAQGSLLYMSPEIKKIAEQGHGDVNKNLCDYMLSDIFSLGLSFLQITNLLSPKDLLLANDYMRGEEIIKKHLQKIEDQDFRKFLGKVLHFNPLERASLEHIQLYLKNH